jgi:hypothetical protein
MRGASKSETTLSCAFMVIASVVMPPWCPPGHVGAVGRGLPARVCYVRVRVGSIVPPPTLSGEQVRDSELSWVSARPGPYCMIVCICNLFMHLQSLYVKQRPHKQIWLRSTIYLCNGRSCARLLLQRTMTNVRTSKLAA